MFQQKNSILTIESLKCDPCVKELIGNIARSFYPSGNGIQQEVCIKTEGAFTADVLELNIVVGEGTFSADASGLTINGVIPTLLGISYSPTVLTPVTDDAQLVTVINGATEVVSGVGNFIRSTYLIKGKIVKLYTYYDNINLYVSYSLYNEDNQLLGSLNDINFYLGLTTFPLTSGTNTSTSQNAIKKYKWDGTSAYFIGTTEYTLLPNDTVSFGECTV